MESLNEIFEEILHSEKDFTDKVTKLRHVDSLIEETEKKLCNAKSITESLYGEYLLKTQKAVDCSARTQLLKSEYEALVEQERELENEEKVLTSQVGKLKEEMECERERFIADATEFSLNYDLCGNGILYRERKEREKIDILKNELEQLETETELLKSEQRMIAEKSAEFENLESENTREISRNADLQKKVNNLKKTVSELKEEKVVLDTSTNHGEFQRMQRELDACRNCQEERDCIDLLKMLQNLQKESYKKQMKHMTKRRFTDTNQPQAAQQLLKQSMVTQQTNKDDVSFQSEYSSSAAELINDLYISDQECQLQEPEDDKVTDLDEYDLATIEAIENIEYSGGKLEDDISSDEHTTQHRVSTARSRSNSGHRTTNTGKISHSTRSDSVPVDNSWYRKTELQQPSASMPLHNSMTNTANKSVAASTSTIDHTKRKAFNLTSRQQSNKQPRKSITIPVSLQQPTSSFAISKGKGTKNMSSSSRVCSSSKRVRFSS